MPPIGDVTWYWRRNAALLPALCCSSDCIVAMAVSMVFRNVLPTSKEAGTSARVRGVAEPSLNVSATRDCCGVVVSAVLVR